EIVLEGYVNPRDRRFETKEAEDSGVQGRHHFHPEWAGYMGKSYKAPTFHVTAVTMRQPASKPIVFALGVHMLDDHNIDTTVREATIFELCNRPQTGIINPIPGGRGQTFMPAERMTAGGQQWTASNTRFEGGMGIDATVPFGYENDFLRPVYPVDKVKPEDFFSKKDLENAKSRMVGWVNSLAKTG